MRITPKENLGLMHATVPTLLAEDASSIIWSIGPIILGLIAVVVVGWFVVVHVRNWMKSSEESGEAFTLDDLRRMHRAGEISEAEFHRAREAMIGAIRSKGTKAPPPRNPDLDVLRQRHLGGPQHTMTSLERAPAAPAPTPSQPSRKSNPTTPSPPSPLPSPLPSPTPSPTPSSAPSRSSVVQPSPARLSPQGHDQTPSTAQAPPTAAPKNSEKPRIPSPLSDTNQQPTAPRRDEVIRRPSILGDQRFLRGSTNHGTEDSSESAAQ
ncbi:MAG: hypothetical protein RIR10_1414 [Planctomycetota bacterium]